MLSGRGKASPNVIQAAVLHYDVSVIHATRYDSGTTKQTTAYASSSSARLDRHSLMWGVRACACCCDYKRACRRHCQYMRHTCPRRPQRRQHQRHALHRVVVLTRGLFLLNLHWTLHIHLNILIARYISLTILGFLLKWVFCVTKLESYKN